MKMKPQIDETVAAMTNGGPPITNRKHVIVKKTIAILLPAVMLAIVAAALASPNAKAQIDAIMPVYLYENGIQVGQVYVPDRAPGQTEYVEDWVLYPNYQYPGPRFMGALQVVPNPLQAPYTSESEFFSKVPFARGSKFVRVIAQEYTSLPGR